MIFMFFFSLKNNHHENWYNENQIPTTTIEKNNPSLTHSFIMHWTYGFYIFFFYFAPFLCVESQTNSGSKYGNKIIHNSTFDIYFFSAFDFHFPNNEYWTFEMEKKKERKTKLLFIGWHINKNETLFTCIVELPVFRIVSDGLDGTSIIRLWLS